MIFLRWHPLLLNRCTSPAPMEIRARSRLSAPETSSARRDFWRDARYRHIRSSKVGPYTETWEGMCLRHIRLEIRQARYSTPAVSGFQGRDRPS